jgi:hypothetical protein
LARLLIRSGEATPGGLVVTRPAGPGVTQPTDTRAAARRSARRWALLVAVGWMVEFGLRLWFSRAQTVPLANPDESAYLIAARVLAGGPATDFSYSTLYQGGYPLLITPVYWFTSNAVTVYHSVLVINAAISALLMPLAYVAGRRLGLVRPAAYAVAMVTALLPAGLFYAEYAMTDAIYPVLVLAWLLTVHSWLTARTARGQYAAAAGSALLAGYAHAVHSRGLVIVLGYVGVGALVAWRRLAPRRTAVAAAVVLVGSVGAGWLLDRYLTSAMYPEGTRNLSAQAASTLHSVHGAINVFEMAAGQFWRLVLDSWGLAGIGLIAALAVIVRPRFRADLRIMAALSAAVTVITAVTAPAALPADQSQTWASGRYLDGMIVTYFVVGAVVLLLRARARFILICAGITAVLTGLTGIIVSVYAGASIPTGTFPTGFNFGEPAVLAQDSSSASVFVSTAVALGLLAIWVLIALAARRWSAVVRGVPVFPGAAGAGGGRARRGEPGGRDPDDQPRLAGHHAGPGGGHDRVRGGHRAQAARPDRRGLHPRHLGPGHRRPLLPLGAAGVRGVLDRAGVLQPRPAPASGRERGRDRLAGRPARVGWLAEPPGRVADRGLQPVRGLDRLAKVLT